MPFFFIIFCSLRNVHYELLPEPHSSSVNSKNFYHFNTVHSPNVTKPQRPFFCFMSDKNSLYEAPQNKTQICSTAKNLCFTTTSDTIPKLRAVKTQSDTAPTLKTTSAYVTKSEVKYERSGDFVKYSPDFLMFQIIARLHGYYPASEINLLCSLADTHPCVDIQNPVSGLCFSSREMAMMMKGCKKENRVKMLDMVQDLSKQINFQFDFENKTEMWSEMPAEKYTFDTTPLNDSKLYFDIKDPNMFAALAGIKTNNKEPGILTKGVALKDLTEVIGQQSNLATKDSLNILQGNLATASLANAKVNHDKQTKEGSGPLSSGSLLNANSSNLTGAMPAKSELATATSALLSTTSSDILRFPVIISYNDLHHTNMALADSGANLNLIGESTLRAMFGSQVDIIRTDSQVLNTSSESQNDNLIFGEVTLKLGFLYKNMIVEQQIKCHVCSSDLREIIIGSGTLRDLHTNIQYKSKQTVITFSVKQNKKICSISLRDNIPWSKHLVNIENVSATEGDVKLVKFRFRGNGFGTIVEQTKENTPYFTSELILNETFTFRSNNLTQDCLLRDVDIELRFNKTADFKAGDIVLNTSNILRQGNTGNYNDNDQIMSYFNMRDSHLEKEMTDHAGLPTFQEDEDEFQHIQQSQLVMGGELPPKSDLTQPNIDHLEGWIKDEVSRIHHEYRHCFVSDNNEIRKFSGREFSLPLNENIPLVKVKSKPEVGERREALDHLLNQLLAAGVIVEYPQEKVKMCSRAFLVGKTLGRNSISDRLENNQKTYERYRLVMDGRFLSKHCPADGYVSLPDLDSLLLQCHDRYPIGLDVCSGYWNLAYKEDDWWKVVFHVGHLNKYFSHVRCIQGQKLSAAYMSTALNMTFNRDDWEQFKRHHDMPLDLDLNVVVFVYVDDIWVLGFSPIQSLQIYTFCLQQLGKYNWTCRVDKVSIFQKKFTILGTTFVRENDNNLYYCTSDLRVSHFSKAPPPSSHRSLFSRLSCASYADRTTPMLKLFTSLLYAFVRSNSNTWDSNIDLVFQIFQFIVTSQVRMRVPNLNKSIVMTSDSSLLSSSSVMMQPREITTNGVKKIVLDIVGCISRLHNKTLTKQSIVAKELYAVVATLKKWVMFIRACKQKTILLVDVRCLIFLAQCRELNATTIDAALLISSLGDRLVCHHVAGNINTIADAASRLFEGSQYETIKVDKHLSELVPDVVKEGTTLTWREIEQIVCKLPNTVYRQLRVVKPQKTRIAEVDHKLFDEALEHVYLSAIIHGYDSVNPNSRLFNKYKASQNRGITRAEFEKFKNRNEHKPVLQSLSCHMTLFSQNSEDAVVDNDDIVVPKSNSCYNCRFVDPFHTIDSCDDAVLFYDVGLYSDARVVSSSSRSVVVSLTRREAAQLPPRLAGIVELGLASNIDIKCHTATLSDIEMVGTEFESLKFYHFLQHPNLSFPAVNKIVLVELDLKSGSKNGLKLLSIDKLTYFLHVYEPNARVYSRLFTDIFSELSKHIFLYPSYQDKFSLNTVMVMSQPYLNGPHYNTQITADMSIPNISKARPILPRFCFMSESENVEGQNSNDSNSNSLDENINFDFEDLEPSEASLVIPETENVEPQNVLNESAESEIEPINDISAENETIDPFADMNVSELAEPAAERLNDTGNPFQNMNITDLVEENNALSEADVVSESQKSALNTLLIISHLIKSNGVMSNGLIKEFQSQDAFVKKIYNKCKASETKQFGRFFLDSRDIVWKTRKCSETKILFNTILIPTYLAQALCDSIHSRGLHWGDFSMCNYFGNIFACKDLLSVVVKSRKQCSTCLFNAKTRHFKYLGEMRSYNTSVPSQTIIGDLIEGLPLSRSNHKAVMLLTDLASGFIVCKALKTTKAHEVTSCLEEVFAIIGAPLHFVSDGGSCWQSSTSELFAMWNITHHRQSVRSEAVGSAEVLISWLKSMVTKAIFTLTSSNRRNWPKFLNLIVSSVNDLAIKSDRQVFSRRELFFSRYNCNYRSSPFWINNVGRALELLKNDRSERLRSLSHNVFDREIKIRDVVVVYRSKLEQPVIDGESRALQPTASDLHRVIGMTPTTVRLHNLINGAEISVNKNKINRVNDEDLTRVQTTLSLIPSIFKNSMYKKPNRHHPLLYETSDLSKEFQGSDVFSCDRKFCIFKQLPNIEIRESDEVTSDKSDDSSDEEEESEVEDSATLRGGAGSVETPDTSSPVELGTDPVVLYDPPLEELLQVPQATTDRPLEPENEEGEISLGLDREDEDGLNESLLRDDNVLLEESEVVNPDAVAVQFVPDSNVEDIILDIPKRRGRPPKKRKRTASTHTTVILRQSKIKWGFNYLQCFNVNDPSSTIDCQVELYNNESRAPLLTKKT